MKEKVILIFLYVLLALMVCVSGIYWIFTFTFNDVVVHYYGGILKLVFLLTISTGIALPIIKYRKHKQKWVLPMVLILIMLVTPVFNNGILKFAEDHLKIYSRSNWNNNRYLRIYMIDDLETQYVLKGKSEEYVKELLGEPDFVSKEKLKCFEYVAGNDFMDVVMYHIYFEDGFVVETATVQH